MNLLTTKQVKEALKEAEQVGRNLYMRDLGHGLRIINARNRRNRSMGVTRTVVETIGGQKIVIDGTEQFDIR